MTLNIGKLFGLCIYECVEKACCICMLGEKVGWVTLGL